MRNLVFYVFLFLEFAKVQAQSFSGELTYFVKIIPKQANLNVDSLMNNEPGTSSKYLIRDNYYKSTYFRDGKRTYSYTYHDDTKRMYDETEGKDYITFRDSRKGNTNRIRSIIYRDSIRVIAGHPCFMVERVYENYVAKTYYAKDLKINPETFQGHQVGDWYNQIKEVDGCLSLGTISEYATYIEEHLVSKIEERPVRIEEFNLPRKYTVASFSALDKNVVLVTPSNETIDCYRKKVEKAKKSNLNEKTTVYVTFIVSETGAITHIEPYKPENSTLDVIAVDIVTNCGLRFAPGQLAGKPVSSLAFFPIEFNP